MDRTDNSPDELEGALEDIRSVNRWLGGSRVLIEAVRPFLLAQDAGRTLTILDIGTGSADLPLALAKEARRLGRPVRILAIDRDAAIVDHARRHALPFHEVTVLQGDAFRLDLPPGSFDLVTASMFLHHFGHDDAVRLLTGFRRIARRAVLVNDLRRHLLPWALIGAAARATFRDPMFVHDAPLSVLRGFTDRELLQAALDTGAGRAIVERKFPFRLLLTLPAERAKA